MERLRRPRLTLRIRLVALALLALAPAFGVILYQENVQRRMEVERVADEALRWARAVAIDQDRSLRGTRLLLEVLGELQVVREGGRECDRLLARMLERYERYANLGVVDTAGRVTCSAHPIVPGERSSRPENQRALPRGDPDFSEYRIGWLSGHPVLTAALPLRDARGHVTGAVFAAISLQWLARTVAQGLPPEATMIIVDHDGHILARQPDPELWLGRMAEWHLVQTVRQRAEGTAVLPGPQEMREVWGFTSVEAEDAAHSPFHVAVALPMVSVDIALAHARNRALATAALVGASVVLLAWFGGTLFVVRPVRALQAAIARLAAGDLSARTGLPQGPAELNQLALAFDEMASSLAERTRQLEAALADNTRLLEQVRAAARLREEFLVAAAHELRTPATVLKGTAQTLLRQRRPDDRERQLLGGVQTAAERVSRLASELVEAHDLSREELSLPRTRQDLTDVVLRAIRATEPLVPGTRFLVCTPGPVELPLAADHLALALSALLDHAARARHGQNAVHLTVDESKAEASVEIRHFGAGIPPERLGRVFEPLFEPWPPGSPYYEGRAGLGLFLARRIIEAHGGHVVAESAPGGGTVFRVRLPRA
jgi:signal transduction histidine kinase